MTFSETETLPEIETENISLKFEDGIAHLSLSGRPTNDTMKDASDWLKEASARHDEFNMCVDVAKMDFPDLGAVNDGFKKLADLWRVAPSAEKCAVLTDSQFLKSKAKIEGSVIPGLDIDSFDLEELGTAMDWLGAEAQAVTPAARPAPETVDLASMFGQTS